MSQIFVLVYRVELAKLDEPGTCGQIFDAKCTSLIPGKPFGQSSLLRVCKPCEGIMNGYDDSSEFSEDGSVSGVGYRSRHGSAGASESIPKPSLAAPRMSNINEMETSSPSALDAVPTMAIPATRRLGDELNRRSAVLEINPELRLARPSSSRSLKGSSRLNTSSHRRHHSKYQLSRGSRVGNDEVAPFHRRYDDDSKLSGRLPAFHSDNIIDPDLAAFVSDEDSSADEQLSIAAAMSGDNLTRGLESDRSNISGLFPSSKKARSRLGEKSITGVTFASRDTDNVSVSSGKMGPQSRGSKRRNLSLTSNVHLRPSPRAHRVSTASPAVGTDLHESMMNAISNQEDQRGVRTIRSSSLKGAAAPPVELNNASIQHVRKLLRQLLQDAEVSRVGQWERALVPTLLQATDDVNPNVQLGDDIDIRHYVKLKKVPGGKPGDTGYVSGLVFTKNLALKSMPRTLVNPNILIVTFPIEYARHHQHFMSLEPVIRQEKEFLQNLVHRIAALRPQLLLVERGVSGLALDFLEAAGIATAYNVKASVLEAVSRCSQTRIVSSIDKLAIMPIQASKCASFSLKTFFFNGRKKTYMYFSGCPKELGCTLVLRGGDESTLIKIKRITEFMVYVVYNLKLETSLMRDEFALIPSYITTGSLSPDKSMSKKLFASNDATNDLKGSSNASALPPGSLKDSVKQEVTSQLQKIDPGMSDDAEVPADIPMPTFYGDMVEKHKVKILSASPFVKFMQPYLLMRAREQERRLAYLKRLQDQDDRESQRVDDDTKPQKFVLIKPEMIHESIRGASRKVREVLRAVHDAELDKALHIYQTQKKQWEAYIAGNLNLFDPYAHQNIAVLYSVVCTVTTVPCSGPDMLALGFYDEHEIDPDFEADCTLGQYVEDLCLGATKVCTANGCERKMYEHHRQYVHGEAQLSVFVEQYPCKMRGLQEVILMWSVCRICGNETQVLPMSDNSWKYSFGKYLELSFWSSELHARAGVCPHDIHRNHIRYFGFKDVALRIQYDPISLLEIIVPRTRITWKVANDLRFKNEVFSKVEERLNRFMASVKSRIKSIKVETVLPEKGELCKEETEKMMKRACDEHITLLRRLQDRYMNSKYYETTPFNSALRAIQEKVVEWDNTFADFDRNFFLPEKDIRRLAALQLKKIFLDRDDSVASLGSSNEGLSPVTDIELTEKLSPDDIHEVASHTAQLSPEKAHDMLTSVIRENSTSSEEQDEYKSAPATSIPSLRTDPSHANDLTQHHQDIRHLDLAMSSNSPEKMTNQYSHINSDGRCISPLTAKIGERNEQNDANNLSVPLARQVPLEGSAEHNASASRASQIPQTRNLRRPLDSSIRRGPLTAPILNRTLSQPVANIRRENSSSSGNASATAAQGVNAHPQDGKSGESHISESNTHPLENIPDRFGHRTKKPGISMIPRSVASRRKESRVSALAKHFEQLSREFEKERSKERRQHAAKSRQARNYPTASSKPIVEVYQDVHEAVEEQDPSDEEEFLEQDSMDTSEEPTPTAQAHAQTTLSQSSGDGCHAEETAAEETADNTETDDNTHVDSHAGSDVDNHSDEDHSTKGIPDMLEKEQSSPNDSQLDLKLDLPKHEKSSLMKMLTNFWAERSASGWNALEYPLNSSDHLFADSDIIVREDEPSSLIAFALGSEDYQSKLQSIQEKSSRLRARPKTVDMESLPPSSDDNTVEKLLLRSTGTHLSYQFREGSAKMLCKIFYAEQFDAVRRKCGVSERIVESLSRCLKWDSKGGKTKSVFLKTLDDRLVLKSLSKIETQAFLKFAPAYFRIISETLFHDLPSVIAKMLGFYQIVIKNPISGVEFDWYVLVMENLFYDRSPTRIFDLKGSMRNRRIQSTGEQNEVLLDENMVEFIYESPLFAREHSKKLLRASVHNDTLFLSQQNVMDYSLMIAIDENRKELVVGIIDCIRTYTWDKKLESWMKDRGKNRPTVTSPREYKRRFREAMSRYVLQAPK